ncbi:MAG: cytochrome d ubiquinol oxidase subunit II [Bifidobacteriaceae bacterium]|jgi:cytochrome d ubiquinol oxidase subunit II|nr:cytochrome d ubiquinol oxidase subunit II [Bifidobacteriaceae bacterium]
MLTNILALAPTEAIDPQGTEDTAKALVGLLKFLALDPTGLETLWFLLIAVLWTGYLVLEGFDFGVGMLLPIIGKRDNERRAMLSTIGPLWDGNEVWVLTAGGATFAAFPEWYATLFSAAYLPLFLILVGLIIRAVAFEYRGKINSDAWRRMWDWCIVVGSWLPSILWGVAFANLVGGVRAGVDAAQLGPSKILYDGTFWNLVLDHQGFLLVGGATTALLFLAHGAIFLSLKTDGIVRERSERLAPKLAIIATVVAAVWVVWLGLKFNGGNHPNLLVWIGIILAAVALVVVILTTMSKKFGIAFASMTVAILAAVVTIFSALFPNVINGAQVKIVGDAVDDPIVGAVVLGTPDYPGGVNLEDVVTATFDGVATTGLSTENVPEATDAYIGDTAAILQDVLDGKYPTFHGLLNAKEVEIAAHATFERVLALGVPLADIGADGATSELADNVTVAVLNSVVAGHFPAAGVVSQVDVERVVAITFARVKAHVPNLADIGVGVDPSDLAVDLTKAVLADVGNGVFPAAGVVSQENVVDVVTITLARLGLPTNEATINQVVADLQTHKESLDQLKAGQITIADLSGATIAGQAADVVATEVARTVQACVPQLQITVNALVPQIAISVDQIVNQQVPATLQAVADATPPANRFVDGTDVTAIITGTVEGWDEAKGMANLNGRIEAANVALGALHTLGLLPGEYENIGEIPDGAVITGMPMHASASSEKTLQLMTIVAVCLVPIVLAYQAWSLVVFRRRISAERIPAESGLEPANK